MAKLETSTDPVAMRVVEVMPTVLEGLRGREHYAAVVAEAQAMAADQKIDINKALEKMAAKRGKVVTIPEGTPDNEFFSKYAGQPAYFVDVAIHPDTSDARVGTHGRMTHLVQDLAVDRALQIRGLKETAPQVRAMLGRAAHDLRLQRGHRRRHLAVHMGHDRPEGDQPAGGADPVPAQVRDPLSPA